MMHLRIVSISIFLPFAFACAGQSQIETAPNGISMSVECNGGVLDIDQNAPNVVDFQCLESTPTIAPTVESTALPTETGMPTSTLVPTHTFQPTETPLPTSTNTPVPTSTPIVNCNDEAINLLSNHSFENGLSNWLFFSDGSASFATVSNNDTPHCLDYVQVSIATQGGNVQLYQHGFFVEGSTDYILRFWGRSEQPRNAQVRLRKHAANYDNYINGANPVVSLTSDWQYFEIPITTKFSVPDRARFTFWLAPYDQNGDVFEFDQISLVKESDLPAPEPTAVSSSPPNGCNIVVNSNESIEAALDGLGLGQTLCISAGVYNETVNVNTQNATIQALDPNNKPVIDGNHTLPTGASLPSGCPFVYEGKQVECFTYTPLVNIGADGVTWDGIDVTRSAGRCMRVWNGGQPIENVTIR